MRDKVSGPASVEGRKYASLFLYMQNRNKEGKNNPLFGVKKSIETIVKLQKLVYVYNSDDMSYLGSYPRIALWPGHR